MLMKWKLAADRRSIKKVGEQIQAAADKVDAELLTEIADAGLRLIRRLELARGHTKLAALWGHTLPTSRGDGTTEITIESAAEGMTFYSRDARGVSDTRYPIKGEDLLWFLEQGVSAHAIDPRSPNGTLAFDTKGGRGRPHGDFGGTRQSSRGIEHLEYRSKSKPRTAFTSTVRHPGFAGNRHVRIVRMILAREALRISESYGRKLRVHLGNMGG